jgi:hypothetical protein
VVPDPLGGLQCTACPAALDPASLQGGLLATTCHVVPYGPRASNIKKRLVGLPVQLGSHVPIAHVHVSKASDVGAIMGLQDVRTCIVFHGCKTCGHVATVRLQCSTGPAGHMQGTAIGQAMQQDQAMLLIMRDVAERQDKTRSTRYPSYH